MIASASREVTISSSIASSDTSENCSLLLGGRSAPRVAPTPWASAWRKPETIVRCQPCAPAFIVWNSSRRRWNSACSAGFSISERVASSADCTTPTSPLTSSSV